VFAPLGRRKTQTMSQFEQENDLGRGGGEVDAETMERAWQTRDERMHVGEAPERENEDVPDPERTGDNP
jgi:hypothetical protein